MSAAMDTFTRSTPAPTVRMQSEDLDEVRSWTESISGRHSRVTHGQGRLGFEMNLRNGHRVDLARSRIQLAQTVRGTLLRSCLHVAVEGASRYAFGRMQLDLGRRQAVIAPQGWEFTRRSEPSTLLALQLKDSAWQTDLLARQPGVADDAVLHPRRLDLEHPAHQALYAAIRALGSAADDPATSTARWRFCEARLVDALGDALLDSAAWVRTPAVSAQRLARLEDWIDTHLGEPITIGQLCQVAEVGDRSLQKAFVERRGTTPMRFVTERRLAAAHLRLSAPTPFDTVSQIALEVGFSHLGRFATLYHQTFGETPSRTLQRRRGGSIRVHVPAAFGGHGRPGSMART